jgi:predicted ferric reductase
MLIKKSKYLLLLVSICLIMALMLVSTVYGRPFRLMKLPDQGKNFRCGTCHINPQGGGPRNPFGQDWEKIAIKAGEQYTPELGKLDSDGDTFTNDEEFAANTNPGDPNSKPNKPVTSTDQKTISNDTNTNPANSKPVKATVSTDQKTTPNSAKKVSDSLNPKSNKPINSTAQKTTTISMPKPEPKTEITDEKSVVLPNSLDSNKSFSIQLGIYTYDFGKLLAITGFILIFFQYVLSSKIKFIERGIGLDKLIRLHRMFGVVGLIFILIHPVALYFGKLLQGDNFRLFTPLKVVGLTALVFLCTAAGAAILYKRLHIKYETWKNIHKVIYFVLPIAFFHSIKIGSDMNVLGFKIIWWILLGFYSLILIYKVWMRFRIRSNPFGITKIVQETYDTWSLYFRGKKVNEYKPGQFMIIRLFRNGKVSESHPFTISSSPTRDELSISVKSVGDFTSTIRDTKTSDVAYIDKPYGVFSFLNHDTKNLVFIAGGIGITPFISMLRYIYDKRLERNVTLIWGNKTSNDLAFRDEMEKMSAEMPSLKVIHVMSGQDDWQGEKGYVDAEKVKKYVNDLENSQFFICGPPVMMGKIVKMLKGLGIPGNRIHFERFALR